MKSDAVFQDLTLQYGKTTALNGVSSSLQPGTTYGLIGRNGAGKTSCRSECRQP